MYYKDCLSFILCFITFNIIFLKIKKLTKNFKRRKEINDCLNQMAEKIVSEFDGLAIVSKEEEEEEEEKGDIREVF